MTRCPFDPSSGADWTRRGRSPIEVRSSLLLVQGPAIQTLKIFVWMLKAVELLLLPVRFGSCKLIKAFLGGSQS